MDLYVIIKGIFAAIEWLVIARIILSFLPMFMRIDHYHPIVRFIYETTEPLLAPFRKILPSTAGLDFSPLLLFLVLGALERLILNLLM
ncbi:hypothetical protein Tfer_3235 [Thermincola ferriacetica]|uniref:YggT family protein n=2 Tax=Thermincola TaxID=278993 RepID=D5X8U0_THEPJ|nr:MULTISPECIES: YggT family protein [Thermincola]ADG82966.1 protein of unknown function YGGT [Thermincola potens JR]KNZ68235.1 hypothetical protein Tfer_3235 [Thermincola ferriacetica]